MILNLKNKFQIICKTSLGFSTKIVMIPGMEKRPISTLNEVNQDRELYD